MKQRFYRCVSGINWSRVIKSTSSKEMYRVSYDAFHKNPHVEYDYTCTCPAFTYNPMKYCKHINEAKKDHCNWDSLIDGGEPSFSVGDEHYNMCPQCGCPVEPYWAKV